MLKRFFSGFDSKLLGAGVALSGVGQAQAPSDNPLPTLVTILVLVTILLPVLMAIFGGIVMRFLGWLTRAPGVEEEVVYAQETLPPGIHLPEPTIWPLVLGMGLMGLMFAIGLQSWLVLILAVLVAVLGLGGWIVLEVKEFQLGRKR